MALYRAVSMNFWTDSKVADDFTPEDKYFYLYLLTNPHTNLCGCYEISMKQVVAEIGYSMDTVEKLIIRFEEFHDVIRYSKVSKEILLLNWHKYQWTSSGKFRKALNSEIGRVKNTEFRKYLEEIAQRGEEGYGSDTVSIPYQYPTDTSVTVTVTDTVTAIEGSNMDFKDLDTAIDYDNKTKSILTDSSNLRDPGEEAKGEEAKTAAKSTCGECVGVRLSKSGADSGKQSKYSSIIAAWNALSPLGIKQVRGIAADGTRINNLRARYNQYGEEAILEAIDRIWQSDFLQGKNRKGWTITFDWFIKPSNFAKVYEGNYDNSSHRKEEPTGADAYFELAMEGRNST